MNTAKAARALDINERTLKLWIAREELSPFFSEPARREGSSRDLNDDDVVVANTIRILRAGAGNNNVDWQGIANALAGNRRERQLPETAAMVDSGMSIVAQQERMASVVEQRDSALQRINELRVEVDKVRSELADLHDARLADTERFFREKSNEQQELRDQLSRTQAELELWRSGRLKPE